MNAADQRDKLIEAMARGMMDVTALVAGAGLDSIEFPVLSLDPDFDDLPRDASEGTPDDCITREAVLKLAARALTAIAEQGYAVVPRETTEAMRKASYGRETKMGFVGNLSPRGLNHSCVWETMVASANLARPEPPK